MPRHTLERLFVHETMVDVLLGVLSVRDELIAAGTDMAFGGRHPVVRSMCGVGEELILFTQVVSAMMGRGDDEVESRAAMVGRASQVRSSLDSLCCLVGDVGAVLETKRKSWVGALEETDCVSGSGADLIGDGETVAT